MIQIITSSAKLVNKIYCQEPEKLLDNIKLFV